MSLDGKDIFQQFLGAFSAVFGLYIIRGGNPLWIDPTVGLVLGIVWLGLVFNPFKNKSMEARTHFISSIIVSLIITTTLTVVFGLATLEELKGFIFFGSSAWILMLVGVPIAVVFDKRNITDILSRHYTRR